MCVCVCVFVSGWCAQAPTTGSHRSAHLLSLFLSLSHATYLLHHSSRPNLVCVDRGLPTKVWRYNLLPNARLMETTLARVVWCYWQQRKALPVTTVETRVQERGRLRIYARAGMIYQSISVSCLTWTPIPLWCLEEHRLIELHKFLTVLH